MRNNDLASWSTVRVVMVLEGIMVRPSYQGRRRKKKLVEADDWPWDNDALKRVVDVVRRNSLAVEVVTFISEEVADQAAEFFLRYDIPVSSTEYVDFEWFCRSLIWRTDVEYVMDTDEERLMRYGSRGYRIELGGDFI